MTGRSVRETKAGKALYSFVEACGEHPFVTGLFALVGIAGLVFAVFGFSVDRDEFAASSEQSSRIEDNIDDVRAKLAEIEKQGDPTSKYPRFKHTYLDADEREGSFNRFLSENENSIVYLSVAFPRLDNPLHSNWDEQYLRYRMRNFWGKEPHQYECEYLFFVNNDALSEYVNWDSGYWHVTGYFRVGRSDTAIAGEDCMTFSRDLTAIPTTNETTTIY